MTQEQKAKAYDKALERAKQVRKYSSDLAEIKRMEDIFPELCESEDERIRKELLNAFQESEDSLYMVLTPFRRESFIAWLEKQGEQKKSYDVCDSSMMDNKKSPYGDKRDFGYFEEKPANKVEPKFYEGEWITNGDYTWKIVEVKPLDYILQSQEGNIVDDTISHVDEQFHSFTIQDAKDGDVLFAENFDNIGGCVFLFKGLDSWKFDAEGDRAVATGYCCASITESGSTDFGIQGPDCVEIKRVHPASKDQRDLLFQKMHEAGYEWDAESKELNKFEDEEYNGEDYGIDDLYHAQRILEKTLGKVDGYQSDDGILEHKCAISAVKKLYEHKPTECIKFNNEFENQVSNLLASVLNGEHEYNESFVKYIAQSLLGYAKNELKPIDWSEEDEEILNTIIADVSRTLRSCGIGTDEHIIRTKAINFLKSLRFQNRWKPSEEQMRALHDINLTGNISYAGQGQTLIELYNDLKKL